MQDIKGDQQNVVNLQIVNNASDKSDALENSPNTKLNLLDALVKQNVITKDQKEIVLRDIQEKRSGETFEQALVRLGFVKMDELGKFISQTSGTSVVDLKNCVIDPVVIKKMPKELALQCKIMPISCQDNVLKIAVQDVYNVVILDKIKMFMGPKYKIQAVYAPESAILDAIDKYYEYELSIHGILQEMETGTLKFNDDELSQQATNAKYTNPTVRLVDSILSDAMHHGTSDIHLEPDEAFVRTRYRIDGRLLQMFSFHKKYWSNVLVRLKVMANINIAETRIPQDGVITTNVMGRNVELRLSTQPTIFGENVVMRILDQNKSIVAIDQLGFCPAHISILKKMLLRPEGVVIITGPTGSGKTTTLYSVLNHVNSVDVNIMTLEDPVEYRLPLVRQSSINEKAGLTFARGLRALMRQDPDIILVGEIRDEETASSAVKAAMTGHQVFTTLHTNDAISAVARLVDIGVKPSLLSGAISGVVAQRLVRKLCSCKKARKLTVVEAKMMRLTKEQFEKAVVYSPVGCEKCMKTGYKGRVVVAEILFFDKEMDELVATNATRKSIFEYAKSKGFITMQADGVQKVLSGIISIEELIGAVNMNVS